MRSCREELPVRALPLGASGDGAVSTLVDREWLVANGIGGYASGTVGGVPTRRFHGVLVSALPTPVKPIEQWAGVEVGKKN